ncbi:unnamed protein product [Debaryomyces tyrocola]|nr:unnamed protein product [Debaryomyces tyrocola]
MSFNTQPPINNTKRRRKQRLFTRDIEQLLYSLGDGPYTSDQTVNALEETLVTYLSDLCHTTLQFARNQGRSRVKIDDFPFALRNDPYKLSRLEYIINQSQKIEKAKKIFDDKNVVSNLSATEKDNDDNDDDNNKHKYEQPNPKKKKRKVTGNVTLRQQDEGSDEN